MNASFIRMCAVTAALVLSGCGGGGGGDSSSSSGGGGTTTPPPGTTTYPFQKAFTALVNAGANDNFSVTGDCTGTATFTTTAPGAQVVFQGVQGFSTTTNQTLSLSTCSRTSFVVSTTYYANATYLPVGYTINGTEWDKYQTLPGSMPAAVAVGDAADLSTLSMYSDSAYTTPNGKRVLSYAVVADGASTSTALVNLTTTVYDVSNNPLYTQRNQYRIDTAGALTLLNIDLTYTTPTAAHLVLSKV
jgi:hypothetical protein